MAQIIIKMNGMRGDFKLSNMEYHDIRDREYELLVSQLKARNIKLTRELFIATLNVITNIEAFNHSKTFAINNESKARGLTKQSIKGVLEDINYITPIRAKQIYKKTYLPKGD